MDRSEQSTAGGVVRMTAAMVLSGTIGVFVVWSGLPVAEVVFWRCVFGAAALLLICAALGVLRPGPGGWRAFAVTGGLAALGGVALVLNWVLLFAAYPRASISVATAVYNTQPFMLVGLGMLLFGERPGLVRLLWLAVAFAGVLLIISAKGGAAGADYLTGIALALGAAFFYAVAAVVAKRLKGEPPHRIALIQVLVGVLMLAPFAAGKALPSGPAAWGSLLTLGIVHTGLMYMLLYAAIQRLPTALVGALSYIYPVVAVVADVVVFSTRPQAVQLIGGAAIVLAAAGSTFGWRPWRRSGAQAAPEKQPVTEK